MNHFPAKTDHWTRQFDQSPKALDTRVFKITKLASSPEERDLIIAMTSKSSAQRLIAAFAEIGGPDRYRVSCFEHPLLPGFQGMEMGALNPDDSAASGSRLGFDYECGDLCLVHAGKQISE